ncbi:MAG: thiamine pyrophosphate-binding protein [Pseudomonadota bacterium]
MTNNLRTGGQILVDQLKIHGVDLAFGVPGESYLPVLDALYDARDLIRFIVCRQEGGAAYMAEAYGKLTGRPGICLVTRGPGASNACIGVHTAFQDSTPMILLIGQVGSDVVEREAFQEIDYRRMFGPMAKWVAQIDRADRVPEMMSHAFHLAVSGRPGPVVLALPEDMLSAKAECDDAAKYQQIQAHPSPQNMAQLQGLLEKAERPLLLLGGGGWSDQACADIRVFAERNSLPVACAFRFQDLFDNRHPNYIGDVGIGINPKLAERVKSSDLVIAVGPRLGEMTTSGYTLFNVPRPKQTLVHIHTGIEELGRVYQAELLMNSGMAEFATWAAVMPIIANPRWQNWLEQGHQDYLANVVPTPIASALDLGSVMAWLREHLPHDAIVTNGAGNYSAWVHRFYQYGGFRTQLAPTSGAMGYGVPAAIAAQLVHSQKTVVAFSGDGCFLMNGQELATAVQYQLPVVFIVVNNGMYGTIRMHQERQYPGREYGTALHNPDFAALARAYGAAGEVVTTTEEFAPAFERALKAGKPALLELRVDSEVITPRTTISAIRATALKNKNHD